jgi:hypothetical protein
MLVKPIIHYLEVGHEAAPLDLKVSDELPTAAERVSHHLQSIL